MRILCFGDSNTYGYDPRDFFGGRYDACWADLLAKQTGWEVINAGCNGRAVPVSLCPLPEHDIFLIMLGTNDLLQGASAAETAARMERFLNGMRPHCGKILLVSPPPMKRGAWVDTDALVAESIRLAEEYRKVAEKLGIEWIDPTDWNIDLCFDGVHFTESDHAVFSEKLYLTLTQRHGL